jgi:hypothetical protein
MFYHNDHIGKHKQQRHQNLYADAITGIFCHGFHKAW